MEEEVALSNVAMHITQGCLVVPIQAELYDEVILQIQRDILEKVSETGVRGVIIDVSGVDIIDSFIARTLSDTARMVSLLGATTVLTGLKPGVVASLVDLGLELKGVQTAINLEEGFRLLEPVVWPEEEFEEPEETADVDPESGADNDEAAGAEEDD